MQARTVAARSTTAAAASGGGGADMSLARFRHSSGFPEIITICFKQLLAVPRKPLHISIDGPAA
jgi:hypothetical protein